MSTNNNRQIRINYYTNIAALVANIIVGIYYTPYLVNSLGLIAYGVLPLALIINQYIGVTTQTLTHAYTRFYSVALQKEEYQEASVVLSTSLRVILIICVCIIPIGIFIAGKPDFIFKIPTQLISSAKYLFLYTLLSFLESIFSSLFNVSLYAINRLDLINVLKIIRSLVKVILVIFFFEIFYVDISFVGLTNFIIETIVLLLSIHFFNRYKPKEVTISLNSYNKQTLYGILGMSLWVLIQLCGDTLIYRTDTIVINRYWGTEASGIVGIISEIGRYVSTCVSVIGSLFGPLILIAFAKNNHDDVKKSFIIQSTIVGCFTAILTGLISGCGASILNLWIGEGMGVYKWWLFLKMITLPYFAAGGIFAFVYRSWNRMKLPAIGTIILGIIDIIILIGVCEVVKPSNPLIILVIVALISFLQCFLLGAISVIRIYSDCKYKFIGITGKISLSFIICYIIGTFFIKIIEVSSFIELLLLLVVLGIIMGMTVCFVIFSKEERKETFKLIH